jgi:hypothetical protein
MDWGQELFEFFHEIELPLSQILGADGCREGWLQGELFRRFRPEHPTFMVNCSISSRREKFDLVWGTPPQFVAEIKVYGLHGYYNKNLCGKSNIDPFLPVSGQDRTFISQENLRELQPEPRSYLGDVEKLLRSTDVPERLMVLVLQKAKAVDRFGQAILAVQVSARELSREFEQFIVRISRI